VEHCKVDGAEPVGVAKIEIGALLDKEIHHDALLVQTRRMQMQAALLSQGEAVLEVVSRDLHHPFLVGVFALNVTQY